MADSVSGAELMPCPSPVAGDSMVGSSVPLEGSQEGKSLHSNKWKVQSEHARGWCVENGFPLLKSHTLVHLKGPWKARRMAPGMALKRVHQG